MTSQTPEEREIEEVVEDFVKGMWYGTGESQYPEGAEKKSYHQGFSDAVAMAYIKLTGIPKSKGLIDKLLLSQQQKHREELQKAREEEKMGILKIALTMGDCPINNPKADAGWMKFQHDFCLKLTKDNKKSILSETDHSELDQDTELLNSVKEDWDKQAKNAMNGLDQEVSK